MKKITNSNYSILTPGQRNAIKEAMHKRFKDRGFPPKGRRDRGPGDFDVNNDRE